MTIMITMIMMMIMMMMTNLRDAFHLGWRQKKVELAGGHRHKRNWLTLSLAAAAAATTAEPLINNAHGLLACWATFSPDPLPSLKVLLVFLPKPKIPFDCLRTSTSTSDCTAEAATTRRPPSSVTDASLTVKVHDSVEDDT
jgi:hypothetical protein